MAIVFPTDPGAQTPVNTFSPTSSPVVNTTNNNRYLWNGVAWTVQNDSRYVNIDGDTMTGTLNAPAMNVDGNSVVGYQEGFWAPSVAVLGADIANGYNGIWAWEGVPNSSTGPGGASPYMDPNQFEHTWHRIGSMVTLTAWGTFLVSDASMTSRLVWTRLPYPIRQPINQTYYALSGSAILQSVPFPTNMYNAASYMWTGTGGNDDLVGIRFSSNIETFGVDMVGKDIAANATISYTITYQTSDTTWTPNNGATVN